MSDYRFSCPHCDQHLAAPPECMGTIIECPTCKKSIQLPEPAPRKRPSSQRYRTAIVPICAVLALLAAGLVVGIFLVNQGDGRVRKQIASLEDTTPVSVLRDCPENSTTAALLRGQSEQGGIGAAPELKNDNRTTTAHKDQAARTAPPKLPQSGGLGRENSPETERTMPTGMANGNAADTPIAYVSGGEIYVMSADGKTRTRITENDRKKWAPVWSPDGSKMACVSNGRICIVDVATGDLNELTEPTGYNRDTYPQWSLDGRRITFRRIIQESEHTYSGFEAWVMNADGTQQTALGGDAVSGGSDFRWSPDGTMIAFYGRMGNKSGLDIVDADGTNHRRLDAGRNFHGRGPSWSPDGSRVVFGTNRRVQEVLGSLEGRLSGTSKANAFLVKLAIVTTFSEIWVIAPDGSGLKCLVSFDDSIGTNKIVWAEQLGNISPQWSPDGTRIAFLSSRDFRPREQHARLGRADKPQYCLYVMSVDGSNQRRLSSISSDDPHNIKAVWSPDSTTIVYSIRGDIWSVSADDGKAELLVRDARDPSIQP